MLFFIDSGHRKGLSRPPKMQSFGALLRHWHRLCLRAPSIALDSQLPPGVALDSQLPSILNCPAIAPGRLCLAGLLSASWFKVKLQSFSELAVAYRYEALEALEALDTRKTKLSFFVFLACSSSNCRAPNNNNHNNNEITRFSQSTRSMQRSPRVGKREIF